MDRHRALIAGLSGLLVISGIVWGAPRAQAADVTFVVEMLSPNQFSPAVLQVNPGDNVTVRVFNNDTIGHTFDLPAFGVHLGTAAVPMAPGENLSVAFAADQAGTFWFFCAVPGHASPRGDGSYSGMAGRLIVGQPSGPDLTILIIGGTVAAGVAATGILMWARRRRPKA